MLEKLAAELERSVQIERETVSLIRFIEFLTSESENVKVRGAAKAILERGPVYRLRKLLDDKPET